ncbi:MAG TPA: SDR family oxidoreductase [Thermoanaerobaculia bacterium]|nr:SDR family oxidoreductase [Thermoanaerobaculia bacterium]
MREQTALITGASSGIGLELAKLAAADGCNLVLISRRQDRLESLARNLSVAHGVSARVLTADLANPKASERIAETLDKERVTVDVLVNNAGLGLYGPFSKSDLQRQLEVLQVNVIALTALTHRLLPAMIERRRGRILNVASTAAFQPGPYMAVYYATKAYVLSFSEAIAEELKGTGVTVTALCPGPTTTEFQDVAGVDAALFPKPLVMDAPEVARAGWAGAKRSKRVVIPGLGNKLIKETVRFSPRGLVTAAAGRLQKKRKPGRD